MTSQSVEASLHHLNEQHKLQILEYLKYFRSKRLHHVEEVERTFEDAKETSLLEDMYTSDDVQAILSGLKNVLKSNISEELETFSHRSVLLLRELFLQAEGNGVNLHIDTAKLDDELLLNDIEKLEGESSDISKSLSNLPPASKNRLGAISGAVDVNLVTKIKDLEEANSRTQDRFKKLQLQFQSTAKENTTLRNEVEKTKTELETLKAASTRIASQEEKEFTAELIQLRNQLEKTQAELNMRVSSTTQFQDLKQILTKKNAQLKAIKTRLLVHEPSFNIDDVN